MSEGLHLSSPSTYDRGVRYTAHRSRNPLTFTPTMNLRPPRDTQQHAGCYWLRRLDSLALRVC